MGKVTTFKYLGQTAHLKDKILHKKKSMPGSKQSRAFSEKKQTRKYFKIEKSPYHSKNK